MKRYFHKSDLTICYYKYVHIAEAKADGLKEVTLLEAIPEKVPGLFFCKDAQQSTEEGFCGRVCNDYEPCNGKSGKCRHKGNFYQPGKEVTFKVK